MPTLMPTQFLFSLLRRLLPWLLYWGQALLWILGLVLAVSLIASGVQGWGGDRVPILLQWVGHPAIGLMVGLLATALSQASGLVIALLVGLVAGGFPIALAIPVVMGANIGTTVTSTLVSLGQSTKDDTFQRSFAAATVHDCFNICTALLFFPLEQLFHPLEFLSGKAVQVIHHSSALLPTLPSLPNPIQGTIAPLIELVHHGVSVLPDPWQPLAFGILGVGLMFLSLPALTRHLQQRLLQPWNDRPWGDNGWKILGMGILFTAIVHSSSATTSLMIPLAGSGVLGLAQIYPFTLGANIGTCLTGLWVVAGLPSDLIPAALQLSFVHLFYNIAGVLCFYGLPGLRSLPPWAANRLAQFARDRKVLAIGYVGLFFFALPGLLVFSAVQP